MKQSEFIMGSYSPMFFILRGAVCIFHAEEVEEGSEAELDTAKGAVLPLSVQPAQNDNAGFVVVALDQNENVGTRKINLRVEHEEQRKVMMDNFREICDRHRELEFILRSPRKQPAPVPVESVRGIAFAMAGLVEPALKWLWASVEKHPTDAVAYCQLGDALHCHRQHEQAVRMYEKALEFCQDYDHARLNLGVQYLALDRLDKANEILAPLMGTRGDDPMVLINMALVHQQKGDRQAAKELFLQALAADPTNVSALVNVGRMALAVGDFDEANVAFTTASSIDATDPDVVAGLAICQRGTLPEIRDTLESPAGR
mmetsp:Transcript_43639/g.136939  ORF Transcript_43639/g.136939 Transcript_43639/m.136939 type:complete len:315 (-) Transcript_43639:258-1202(-)